jgi:hypothetical protein
MHSYVQVRDLVGNYNCQHAKHDYMAVAFIVFLLLSYMLSTINCKFKVSPLSDSLKYNHVIKIL